jgi:hypothetical protein
MLSELEYLLKAHGEYEGLSDQSSLQDVVTDLHRLAKELGLDFRLALAGAGVENDWVLTLRAFDACI